MSMKNSSDTIRNRTRDLPVCSAVPQPTAPPAACPPGPTVARINDLGCCMSFGLIVSQLLGTDDGGAARRRNFGDYLLIDTASHHIDCIVRQHRCVNLGPCSLTVGRRILVCSRRSVNGSQSGSFGDQQ
jgi:hypothetical protein